MTVKQAARPRAYRSRPNRPEQILAAACRVIQERGFAGTRISDIAREAGTSTGTVHYWFAVKDEVLTAALKWASEQLFARLEQMAAGVETERERLAQLLEASLPSTGPRRGEYMLWMELWVRALHDPGLLPDCEDLSRRWRGFFFDTVRRGTKAGEFAPVTDPDDVADRLLALVDGLGFELLLGYEWTSPQRMRAKMHAFAAEQLKLSHAGIERDARAAAAALEGAPAR
jgi:AcrR family transcriptional regulator